MRIRLIKFVIIGVLVANLAFYSAAFFYPPLAAYCLGAVGRVQLCRLGEAAAGIRRHVARYRTTQAWSPAVRVVSTASKLELWDTPRGQWWLPAGTDRGVLPVLLAQQEASYYGLGATAVRPGDVVLDCGAHVGVFTRKALELGAAKVISIEPAPENLVSLRRNLEREIAEDRVIPYPKGVWDRVDSLTLFQPSSNSAGASFLLPEVKGEREISEVPVTTIDNLVAELGLGRVDFIKMDIKGATERALLGAANTLRRDRPRLAISTEEIGDEPPRILKTVQAIEPGYQASCGPCSVQGLLVRAQVLYFSFRQKQ